MLSGVDMWLNTLIPGIGLGYTLKHGKPDHASLKPAAAMPRIDYPRADGVLTFDRLTNVSFSATNHEEDQPVHLKVADMPLQKRSEHDVYAGPSNRYCPAGVYEWVEEGGQAALRHQRAELRALQNLRHQGPQPEHQLGGAGGRRRAELSGHVVVSRRKMADYLAASAGRRAGMRRLRGRIFLPVAAVSAGGSTSRLGHRPVISERA